MSAGGADKAGGGESLSLPVCSSLAGDDRSPGSGKAAVGGRGKRQSPADWPAAAAPALPQRPPRGRRPRGAQSSPGSAPAARRQLPASACPTLPEPSAPAAGVGGHVRPRVRSSAPRSSQLREREDDGEDGRRQMGQRRGRGWGRGVGGESLRAPPRPAPAGATCTAFSQCGLKKAPSCRSPPRLGKLSKGSEDDNSEDKIVIIIKANSGGGLTPCKARFPARYSYNL